MYESDWVNVYLDDVELPDGTHVRSDRFMVAVCACGRSRTYPLCDTSHRRRRRE